MKDWNSITIDRYYSDLRPLCRVGIGILDIRRDISDTHISKRSFDMTYFYINRMIKMGLCNYRGFETSVKSILEESFNAGDEYCMIACQGLLLFRGPSLIVQSQDYASKNPNFFVIGHILKKEDRYPGLHRQYLFVNLAIWNRLGRPEFDEPGVFRDRAPVYLDYKTSDSTVYADYTPYWISRNGDREKARMITEDGSNWIDLALRNDIRIDNLTNDMRDCKVFIYPYQDTDILAKVWYDKQNEELVDSLTNMSQRGWIRKLAYQEAIEKDRVYAFNTEKLSAEGVRSVDPVDHIFSAAAGFKPLALLENNRFHENTEVHYFDWCSASLDFKKDLLGSWDGIDFDKWLLGHDIKYNFSSTYRGNYKDFWNLELKEFGGPEKFKMVWDRYRKCKHTFNIIDIVNEPEKLFNLITKTQGIKVLWTTNIWSSEMLHWNMEPEDIEKLWNRFESLIPPDLILYGHDFLAMDMQSRIRNGHTPRPIRYI